MAGIRCAKVVGKDGEPAEPWGEDVWHPFITPPPLKQMPLLGQILYRISHAPTSSSGQTTIRPYTRRVAILVNCISSAHTCEHVHRYCNTPQR